MRNTIKETEAKFDNNNTGHAEDPAKTSGVSPPSVEAFEFTMLAIEVTREMLPRHGMCGEEVDSPAWHDRIRHRLPNVDPRALKAAVLEVLSAIHQQQGFSVLDEDSEPNADLVARIEDRLACLVEEDAIHECERKGQKQRGSKGRQGTVGP